MKSLKNGADDAHPENVHANASSQHAGVDARDAYRVQQSQHVRAHGADRLRNEYVCGHAIAAHAYVRVRDVRLCVVRRRQPSKSPRLAASN